MAYDNIREEAIKLKVANDWFGKFDCTDILGRIDFAVKIPTVQNSLFGDDYLLWAEAKQNATDVYRMLAQLLLTIHQDAKKLNPPKFVGCFDTEKIAFVEYYNVLPIFSVNDFNWTQTPSAVDDKSVETVRRTIESSKVFTFFFDTDQVELRNFVKKNFAINGPENLLATQIDRNNYTFIYQKWRAMVAPFIDVNWELLKKSYSIYDRDFFLAELNVDDNGTTCIDDDNAAVKDFYISFSSNSPKQYTLNRKDPMGLDIVYQFGFKKGGLETYTEFWKRYKRPPKKEYWDFIVSRLDLLVPQDVRERKGAFFTPQIWVEKSQEYIADVLGENWQDEYYVWDCCAGTGNLLAGLTNKYNIWASTLDQADVDVMYDRIKNGANLLEKHVFQFDFLNDDFSKLPQPLQEIINDPEKRRKLVIYINPPYAEATTATTVTGTGENKSKVATENATYLKYRSQIGKASNELFAQFFIRIYQEIPGATLAEFSKLKILQASNFADFRSIFKAKLEKMFVVPAKTFDNVKGSFPIGFFVWNTDKKEDFKCIYAEALNSEGVFLARKKIFIEEENSLRLNKWIKGFDDKRNKGIGFMGNPSPDFQHCSQLYISVNEGIEHFNFYNFTASNLFVGCIYLAVRHCIEATWLNDRDQFLYPNDGWQEDKEFQSDCLAFTLFHGQNRISSHQGVNHWIPFTESEVEAKEKFESHFMVDFIAGRDAARHVPTEQTDLFASEVSDKQLVPTEPMQFSAEATAVFDAGRELWRYYHAQSGVNPNASLRYQGVFSGS